MKIEDLELLKTLSSLPGISGHEEAVADYIKQKISQLGFNFKVDVLGNIIVRVPAKKNVSNKIMVFAHMDEIGFLVRRIDKNGMLRIERVGGVPEKCLQGQSVMVCSKFGLIPGIIGTKSYHLTLPEERALLPRFEEIYVDIGASSSEEVEKLGIKIGTPIIYAPRFYFLINNMISGKALDDRAGCWVLIKILEYLKNTNFNSTEIFVVFTVQEEFHLQGALVAAKVVKPQLALCIDIAVATDTPDLSGLGSEILLGKGPVIQTFTFHGRGSLIGLIPNPRLVEKVIDVAETSNIPYQLGVFRGGLTDASYLHLAGFGAVALDIGIPTRYTHSPLETCSEKDLNNTLLFLIYLIEKCADILNYINKIV